jgi:hypothetical protein
VARLDVSRFAKVAQIIADALEANQHRRLTKKEVLAIVVEAVKKDLVSVDESEKKVRFEVEKVMDMNEN